MNRFNLPAIKILQLFIITFIGITMFGCAQLSKEEKYNKMSAKEIYQQGHKNAQKRRFPDASEDFEALEARYPFGEYAEQAQLGAIYSLYRSDEYSQAQAAADRFIREHPRHKYVDYAFYIKGLVSFAESLGFISKYLPMERAQRDTKAAEETLVNFAELIQRYPQSQYAPDAKKRMVYIRNVLAENELHAARFYMNRDAYLAAANRGNYVVEHFDQSPQVEEALVIMVKAYKELALYDLANDALKVLRHNFPNSPTLKTLS